jgi:hypothetical protein
MQFGSVACAILERGRTFLNIKKMHLKAAEGNGNKV